MCCEIQEFCTSKGPLIENGFFQVQNIGAESLHDLCTGVVTARIHGAPPLQLNHSIWTPTRIVANRLLSACSIIVSVVLPLRWRAQPKISPIRKMQRMPNQ